MANHTSTSDQRIRDPVHDLVVFSGSDSFEQLNWSLINTPEFQRLRRIKQLGFSELVYPGATHTRFSHSIGVFHTARSLVEVIKRSLGCRFSEDAAKVAVCAALLHDLGHGPFSHAFEGAEKARKKPKKHERWTTEIIQGDTCIGHLLSEYDEDFRLKVAALLEEEDPSSIYSSIVSSQFDADRLDYLRRDKLMTGTGHGGFDWAWLLNNLEVATLTISDGGDPEELIEVEGLILGHKGLRAAEAYLLGRIHLYTQVYMHKTTRAAEKMLEALLQKIAQLVVEGNGDHTGLPSNHPLRLYLEDNSPVLERYLSLDDSTVWGSLPMLERSECDDIAELACRLRRRKLYKCFDVEERAKPVGGDAAARFQKHLREEFPDKLPSNIDILQDRAKVSPYTLYEYDSPDALAKICIRASDGSDRHEDVAKRSEVVKALGEERIFRVYARNSAVEETLSDIWEEILK